MKTSRQNEVLIDEFIVAVRRVRGRRGVSVDVESCAPRDRDFMKAIAAVVAAWFNRPTWRNMHDA